MNYTRLTEFVKKHEGLRLKPYQDSRGFQTIGWGHRARGKWVPITRLHAEQILQGDLAFAGVVVDRWLFSTGISEPNAGLTDARRAALVDMAFNLGPGGLATFRKLRSAVVAGDWEDAAAQMLDSLWARQVGTRAEEDARMMRTGEWA